jgi:hypothetical protein
MQEAKRESSRVETVDQYQARLEADVRGKDAIEMQRQAAPMLASLIDRVRATSATPDRVQTSR